MYFCSSSCAVQWYNEHWWKCREIAGFFVRHPEKKPLFSVYENPYVSQARRMYWDKRPGLDHTERNIMRSYQGQPKRKEYLLNKHRLQKFRTQVIANKQNAVWRQGKKLQEKYGIDKAVEFVKQQNNIAI